MDSGSNATESCAPKNKSNHFKPKQNIESAYDNMKHAKFTSEHASVN